MSSPAIGPTRGFGGWGRLLGCGGACLLLFPAALQAQTVWDMPRYRKTRGRAGPDGLHKASRRIQRRQTRIRPSFDAKAAQIGGIAAFAEAGCGGRCFAARSRRRPDLGATFAALSGTSTPRQSLPTSRGRICAALQKKGMRLNIDAWRLRHWSKNAADVTSGLAGLYIRTYEDLTKYSQHPRPSRSISLRIHAEMVVAASTRCVSGDAAPAASFGSSCPV